MDTVAPLPAASVRPDLPAPSAASTDKSTNDSRAFDRMLQKLADAKNEQADTKDSGSNTPRTRDVNNGKHDTTRAQQASNDDKQPAQSTTKSNGNTTTNAPAKSGKSNDDADKNATSGTTTQAASDDASTTKDAAAPATDATTQTTLAVLVLQADAPVPVAAAPTTPTPAAAETPAEQLAAAPAATAQAAAATAATTKDAQPQQEAATDPTTTTATPATDAKIDATATAPATAQAETKPANAADATKAVTDAPLLAATAEEATAPAAPATTDPAAQTADKKTAATDGKTQAVATQAPATTDAVKTASAKPAAEDEKKVDAKEPEQEPAKTFAEHVAETRNPHDPAAAPKVEVAVKPAGTETTPQIDGTRGTQTHSAADAARTASTDTTLSLAPKNPALAASAVAQVGFHLARAGADGQQAMTIQLRPEELGSIEVKLDIGRDGVVHAHVVADRSDTLDLLRSDPRGLQRALENAGLTTDGGSLSFDLRQGGQGQQGGNGLAQNDFSGSAGNDGGLDLDLAVVERPRVVADGRVDVTV